MPRCHLRRSPNSPQNIDLGVSEAPYDGLQLSSTFNRYEALPYSTVVWHNVVPATGLELSEYAPRTNGKSSGTQRGSRRRITTKPCQEGCETDLPDLTYMDACSLPVLPFLSPRHALFASFFSSSLSSVPAHVPIFLFHLRPNFLNPPVF